MHELTPKQRAKMLSLLTEKEVGQSLMRWMPNTGRQPWSSCPAGNGSRYLAPREPSCMVRWQIVELETSNRSCQATHRTRLAGSNEVKPQSPVMRLSASLAAVMLLGMHNAPCLGSTIESNSFLISV